MEKTSDLFCNKYLGGSVRRYLAPFQRHFDTAVFVATTYGGLKSFFSGQQRKNACNISVTVKTVGGISLCDGGKLPKKESEGYNYCFVVFYVLESK